MKNNYKEFVIFTSDLDYMSGSDNRKRLKHLKGVLDDLHINYTDCNGYYEGMSENSLYVELDHSKGFNEDFFTDLLCGSYDQECILHRDKYNKCYLLDKSKTSFIGKLTEIDFDAFMMCDNATEIHGKYWTVK